ncbi:hypothetical protein LOK49_LG13G01979 [Camellia lanceoleosa]|uniref:Uncharacterized protein n=1 Tax=Camellia lanceoleosa TaxID=1840588 RepID=A0ACC0FH85_9ERIC|nr:hypothetical protein LOK49_LG13G01979 [Camellia lanceoleosa]
MSTASSSSNSNSNSNSKDKSSKLIEKNFDLADVLKKEYFRIKSYTDQTLVLQDWKKVQQSIKEGISEECLYLLMSMACHLPNPEDGLPLMADHYPNSTFSSQTKLRSTNPIRKVPRIQPNREANQDTRYQYDSDRTKLGLLRFVIVQHLKLTGMSAYQMFVEVIHKLTLMTTEPFLARLRIPETEDCIDEIGRICMSFDRPSHKQRLYSIKILEIC